MVEPDPEGESSSRQAARPGWKLRLEDRLDILDPISVRVFRSFGTQESLRLRGRVIERKGVKGVRQDTPTWRNILNTLRRFDSDEIPGAQLRAHLGGESWDMTTDEEGYFALEVDVAEPLTPGWHEVSIELVDSVGRPAARFARERVLVPSPQAEFAVISDLDDTVIRSRATDLLQELTILLGKGARTRTPFPGVPALYRALSRGPDDRGDNPMFYVSRSDWNLYDLLEEFLDLNDIPRGPLCLSDVRLIEAKSTAIGSDRPKRDTIDLLLRTYPQLSFLLIGDSGQGDPELYLEIARDHPGRIRAVYLHDVADRGRDREVRKIAGMLDDEGVPTVYAEDVLPVAEHAAEQDFISPKGLDDVRQAVREAEDQ